jgi:hypothetical protein
VDISEKNIRRVWQMLWYSSVEEVAKELVENLNTSPEIAFLLVKAAEVLLQGE